MGKGEVMAGPWEQYQSKSESGPWEQYKSSLPPEAASMKRPEEPGLEPVGLLESFIAPVKAVGMTLPAIKAAERFGPPIVKSIAEQMLPKTGAQLAGQALTAGTAGVAGELASRSVPEPYKPLARTGAELATGMATTMTPKIGRGPTPAIPQERIDAARYLESIGGKPSPNQIAKGPYAEPTARRLTTQQGVANQEYNRAVGLATEGKAVPNSFGKKEFQDAMIKANNDYNTLLKNRVVEFDNNFFNQIKETLQRQQGLSESGITFGQSRALIGALQKIGSVPQNLKSRIDKLPRIGEEEATAKESQEALTILNDMLPSLAKKGNIQMAATDYNEIRSILGDAASRATNNRTASLLRKVQGAFDQAADRSMPEIVRDLEGVRRRYEALKTLEEAQLKSGVEIGLIPAQAVGQAIKARIEQGAIYGNNNPLRKIGEAGTSMAITAPGGGERLAGELQRGLTPRSTMWGAIRDIAQIPVYPIKKYLAGRRLEDVPSTAGAVVPTGAALLTEPERK